MTNIEDKEKEESSCFESEDVTAKQYKIILGKLSKGTFQADKIEVLKNGDDLTGFVDVTIDTKELGIPFKMYTSKFGKVLSTLHMVNFIGEMVVKTNINKITSEVLKVNSTKFLEITNASSHLNFGVKYDFTSKNIIFIFHISLLPRILTEEFKRNINY